jgi:myo-inositol 2-dehydrogenase/D-chiro-inositol 1-dehydrogenase
MVASANLTQTGIERFGPSGTAQRAPLIPGFMERYLPTYATELDYFIQTVSRGEKPQPSFHSGRNAMLLADAARTSMKEGRLVRVTLGQ